MGDYPWILKVGDLTWIFSVVGNLSKLQILKAEAVEYKAVDADGSITLGAVVLAQI